MIPAGEGRHRDHFSLPDLSRAACTSSRVTWGGGDCLDTSGELVKGCPRHQPATYVATARHKAAQPPPVHLDRWTAVRPSAANWRRLATLAGFRPDDWQVRVMDELLEDRA